MSATNQVIIVGRVGNDPEIKRVKDSAIVELRLAVNRQTKDKVTDWISCSFWGRNAEVVDQYVRKGDLISVSGSLRVDQYEHKGVQRQKCYVYVESMQMLGGKQQQQQQDSKYSDEDDLPF